MNQRSALNSPLSMSSFDFRKEDATVHHAMDLIHLNVGGKRFTTQIETLLQGKSSFFANFLRVDRVSGKCILYNQRYMRDESGAVFVNRDGKLFAYVLQYMRDGKKTVLPEDVTLLKQLKREAEFFGMEALKAALQDETSSKDRLQDDGRTELVDIRNSVNQIAQQVYYNGIRR